MKKTVLVISIVVMLLILPINSIAQENMINNKLNTLQTNLDQKFIEKFGEERHIELYNNIVTSIMPHLCVSVDFNYDHRYVEIEDYSTSRMLDYYSFMTIFIMICMMIAEFCMLLFGHNEVGQQISALICAFILIIPIWMIGSRLMLIDTFATGEALDLLLEWLDGGISIPLLDQLSEILYQYGLIGSIVVMLITAPILIIALPLLLLVLLLAPFIALPFIRGCYTLMLLETILYNVFG